MERKSVEWLHEHVCNMTGPIFESLPVKANVGEGFKFVNEDTEYETVGNRNEEGLRIAQVRIETFIGYCPEAVHWYCRINIPIHSKNGNRTVFVPGIPSINKTISFDVCKPLTQEEIDNDPKRWEGYESGERSLAFQNKDELIQIIKDIESFFDTGWIFKINE